MSAIRNLTTAARFLSARLAPSQARSWGGSFVVPARSMQHYPIDEYLFGLTEDQQQVCVQQRMEPLKIVVVIILHFICFLFFLQLRQTVFNFAQKELAPLAQEIDKQNEFK